MRGEAQDALLRAMDGPTDAVRACCASTDEESSACGLAANNCLPPRRDLGRHTARPGCAQAALRIYRFHPRGEPLGRPPDRGASRGRATDKTASARPRLSTRPRWCRPLESCNVARRAAPASSRLAGSRECGHSFTHGNSARGQLRHETVSWPASGGPARRPPSCRARGARRKAKTRPVEARDAERPPPASLEASLARAPSRPRTRPARPA